MDSPLRPDSATTRDHQMARNYVATSLAPRVHALHPWLTHRHMRGTLQETDNPPLHLAQPAQLALPQNQHLPSKPPELGQVAGVPLDITLQFCSPVMGPGCWYSPATAPITGVLVPEAPMHENRLLARPERQVRLARKVLAMQPVAIPQAMHKAANQHLRLRVLAFDRAHHGAPGFRHVKPKRAAFDRWRCHRSRRKVFVRTHHLPRPMNRGATTQSFAAASTPCGQ